MGDRRFVPTNERLEHPLHRSVVDTDARIGDGEGDRAIRCAGDADAHMAIGGVLHRIADHVVEDLAEVVAVTHHHGRRGRIDRHPDVDGVAPQIAGSHRRHRTDQAVQIEAGETQLEPHLFDPAEVEQVVDDSLECEGLRVEGGCHRTLVGAVEALGEEFGDAADAVQWVAELVADRRDERLLTPRRDHLGLAALVELVLGRLLLGDVATD